MQLSTEAAICSPRPSLSSRGGRRSWLTGHVSARKDIEQGVTLRMFAATRRQRVVLLGHGAESAVGQGVIKEKMNKVSRPARKLEAERMVWE